LKGGLADQRKFSEEIIGIGSFEPGHQIGVRVFSANDRSHFKILVLIEYASRLHPRLGGCSFGGMDWVVDLGLDFGG
jgi:hypothetical protein